MGKAFKSFLFGAISGPLFLFIGLGMLYFFVSQLNVNLKPILTVIIALSPIWLPIALFYLLFEEWQYYIRAKFAYNSGRVTLRIKLPQEVLKSPETMESVFTQIHNISTADNLMQVYFEGRYPLNDSFELVSIGGEVRFYVNVPRKKIKNIMEAQLYAQYPGVEVVEEPVDYAAEIKWDPKVWDMISFHIGKREDEVFPIKTYIDYGLDKVPKEELKFEPMAPMLEYLGTAKPHERVFIQIIAKPHAKQDINTGNLGKIPTWEGKALAKVNELMGRDKARLGPEETESRPVLTMSERDTIGAIERNISKYAYEVGIRAMYISQAGKFDPEMIAPMLKSFAQFDMLGRNSLGARWRTDFDYNFLSDASGKRKLIMKQRELEDYKTRSYYYRDYQNRADLTKVMSVEELATIYHIPGTSVLTPNLSRVESNRKEAPANLPVAPPNLF